jgi:hypothetical protein
VIAPVAGERLAENGVDGRQIVGGFDRGDLDTVRCRARLDRPG